MTVGNQPPAAQCLFRSVMAERERRGGASQLTARFERAYFIHLEDGDSDELGNWLRAERELSAA